MSAASQTESAGEQVIEESRQPAVSLSEVLAACREMEVEGLSVTRRSVRERLGRGSMTTIHNGVSQFESRCLPQTPRLDLTVADREVISDLGARALAVAEERVQNIIAEREAALGLLIVAAEGRAADALATADTLVAEAERRTIEAEASRNAAVIERGAAQVVAEAAERQALRLAGQVTQLTDDRASAMARAEELFGELASARTRAELQATNREQAEGRVRSLETALSGLRGEYAARKQEDADQILELSQTLSAEQARLLEATRQREIEQASAERHQAELARCLASLSETAAVLARTEATVAARNETFTRLSDELTAAQDHVRELSAAVQSSVQGLDALREGVSSTIAVAEDRLTAKISMLHQDILEQRVSTLASTAGR